MNLSKDLLMLHQWSQVSLREIRNVAHEIYLAISRCPLVLLIGEVGSGKTTLIQELVSYFGYSGRVQSPSFSLMNEYETPKQMIYHLDLYRIKNLDEIEELDMISLFDCQKKPVVLVEWGDILLQHSVVHSFVLFLEEESEVLRSIVLKKHKDFEF